MSPSRRGSVRAMSWSRTTRSPSLPSSIEPVSASRWLTQAPPFVNAPRALSRLSASAGRKGSAARFSGEIRFTATSISAMTLGVLTVQSRAAHEPGAGGLERAERVLQGGPPRRQEGQGQLVHLGIVAGPVGLDVGRDVELPEAGILGRIDDLEMGHVMAPLGGPVRPPGRLDRVERLPDGAIAEGVEVDLEAECVQPADVVLEQLRVDEADPAIRRGAAAGRAIRLEHRRRVVLGDPVLHDLHGVRAQPADLPGPPAFDDLVDLLGPLVTIPPVAGDRPSG